MDVDLHLKSSSNQQRLAITYRRIEELKPDPANPRRHSSKQIRQIFCPNCRPVSRSPKSAICGSSAATACCAAALSTLQSSRR